jgi:Zinc carboxypeptidase
MANFKKLLILFFLVFVSKITFSQNNLKSPEEFFSFKFGEQFTPHHLLVEYYKHVAKNSDQIIVQEYGRTNEQRPLIWAVISSPKNLKNLEQIRTDNLKRARLIEGKPSDSKPIAIVWLSYGVHGNEAGASESSIATLYEIAKPGNKKIQSFLENTVVIIDPCINPDGYSRYSHWQWNVNNKIVNPNSATLEHNEPWPGGRVNHYLFDLNRDWAWFTQVETQQRLDIYNQWMPHIHVDLHEMGHNSPYYFAPAAQPYHKYITNWQGDFQKEIGQNHAKYFDENAWLYYTREDFDLFYPSYGDTYPVFNGSIGMTYEQAGHSQAGRAILLENGDTLTLKDRIAHHKSTSLSTIEMGALNADRLVQKFEEYFSESVENPKGKYKTFVISYTNSKDKIKALCNFLDKHKIQYGSAENELSVKGYHYATGKTESYRIDTQDIVVTTYQPKSVLAQVLFEPNPFLMDSLTYDITAWTLTHAYGLDAFALEQKIDVNQGYEFPKYISDLKKESTPYAYLLEWQSIEDARFLGALLSKKIKVRFANKSFELEGKKYGLGTLIISKADNRKNQKLAAIITDLAQRFERNIVAVESGFSSNGYDLGSSENHLISTPNIAILQDDRIFASAFGQVWHYFENDLGYPVTILPLKRLRYADLRKYNLIIMPEGSYSSSSLNIDKLKTWISGGGRLIAMGNALSALEGQKGFTIEKYATAKEKGDAKKDNENTVLENRLKPYADRRRRSISNQMPGAIFKLKMDNTHPLAYGLPDYYFSLKTSSRAYKFLKKTWNVGYIEKDPLILGFAGAKAIKKMEETTVFGVQTMGRGDVIYMVDNPLFRGFWQQGKFLFSNAVFLAGQ